MRLWLSFTIVLFFISNEATAQSTKIDSSNKSIVSPKTGLRPILLPQLDRLEKSVAKQIKSFQQDFSNSIAKGRLVSDVDLMESYGILGQLYHAYELTESAESCYLNALSLAPSDYRWLHLLAVLYQQLGNLEQAEHYFKTVREINFKYVAAAVHLGSVYLQLNRLEEARKEFQAALSTDSTCAAAHNGLGQAALTERKFSEAINHFEMALKRVPAANRIHYSLALAYRGLGNLEKAESYLRQRGTVGVRPVDPLVDALKNLIQGERVHLIQGRMALSARRFEDAAIAFAKAVDAKPASVRARVNLGVCLAQLGETDKSIGQFHAALKYDPENQNARFNLGAQLVIKKEYAQAIKHFQAVLRADSTDLETTRELAKALRRTGRDDQAMDYLSKANKHAPADELTMLDLCDLLIKHQRYKEALALLDRANRLAPDRGLTAHDLARLLAVCQDTTLRDGERALNLATMVYNAQKTTTHAETLAFALAEVGRCDEAANLQKQLVAMAGELNNDALLSRLKKDLTRYEKGKPCRPPGQKLK